MEAGAAPRWGKSRMWQLEAHGVPRGGDRIRSELVAPSQPGILVTDPALLQAVLIPCYSWQRIPSLGFFLCGKDLLGYTGGRSRGRCCRSSGASAAEIHSA